MSASIYTIHKVKTRTPLYGLLYNVYAMDDANGLAPTGCHIPTTSEISTLISYTGGAPMPWNIASSCLRLIESGTTHWQSPNTYGNDYFGFTLLPSGIRSSIGFINKNYKGYISSNKYSPTVFATDLHTGDSVRTAGVNESIAYYLGEGFPVRCLLDDPSSWYSGMTITDYDGNIYDVVKIGTQAWLKQNLAVTHYKNGVVIPEVTDQASWNSPSTGALCAYLNEWTEVFK